MRRSGGEADPATARRRGGSGGGSGAWVPDLAASASSFALPLLRQLLGRQWRCHRGYPLQLEGGWASTHEPATGWVGMHPAPRLLLADDSRCPDRFLAMQVMLAAAPTSWTKFPEAAVDGGQRPALKRLVDEVEKQTGTREDSASECHPGRHPRHGHRQRSSPAANMKGRGDAEMSTWDERAATNDWLRWQEI
uniref:Uncharacterized protein n=1 Tax=Oryza rufipogon TaxID=4529 RepID=A0A0E0RC52_ORYRU